MLRIILIGALAAVALGQLPMGMMDIGSMMKNLPPGALENAMKDMTPEKLKDMVKHLPPQVESMMAGMGLTKDKIDQALEKIPDDMDLTEVMDKVKNKMGGQEMNLVGLKNMMLENGMSGKLKDQLKEMLPQMKDGLVKSLKEEYGLDLGEATKEDIVQKIKEYAIEQLKEQGIEIDPDDREGAVMILRKEMKKAMGVSPDMDDEEFRKMVGRDLFTMLKEEGFDVNPDDTDASFEVLKDFAKSKAKEYGFDISDGVTLGSLKSQAMDKLRTMGVPVDDPDKLLEFGLDKIQTFMPLIQQFMGAMTPEMQQPRAMPRPMARPMAVARPMPQMPLTLNLEINVDEGDHPTTVGLPYGMRRSGFDEEEVTELMQDLLYYRTLAKQLIVRNQMLQRKLESVALQERPVMSKSPILAALLQ